MGRCPGCGPRLPDACTGRPTGRAWHTARMLQLAIVTAECLCDVRLDAWCSKVNGYCLLHAARFICLCIQVRQAMQMPILLLGFAQRTPSRTKRRGAYPLSRPPRERRESWCQCLCSGFVSALPSL